MHGVLLEGAFYMTLVHMLTLFDRYAFCITFKVPLTKNSKELSLCITINDCFYS